VLNEIVSVRATDFFIFQVKAMKHKNLILLGIISCSLLFAIFYLHTVYISWQSEILKFQTETKKLNTQEKILSNFKAQNKNIDDFVNLYEENFLTVRDFLPAESEQEKFTDAIYRAATKNNISVTSLQVAEPVATEVDKNISGDFFKQSVKVQFDAEYINLLNFLREISDGTRFITLANISVEDGEEILNCDAEFFIYSANLTEQ